MTTTQGIAKPAFQQTIFFGDSLSDSGYYRPLLPNEIQAITGKFTTNPGWVWSEYVASYYGSNASPNGNSQSGNNYAAGGAHINEPSISILGEAQSLTSQTNAYLSAHGGKADPSALYTLWGGANDLLDTLTTPEQIHTIIGNATTAEISLVSTLKNAGAHYILVAAIPDLGLAPRARNTGTTAQSTAAATAYNTTLFTALKSAGLQVIPIDTFHLLQELITSPATYGFSNTTDTACTLQLPLCNPTTLVDANAPNTYAFADDIHPTTAAHHMLGQYAISILEAPRLQQVLTRSAQGDRPRPRLPSCSGIWTAHRSRMACTGGAARAATHSAMTVTTCTKALHRPASSDLTGTAAKSCPVALSATDVCMPTSAMETAPSSKKTPPWAAFQAGIPVPSGSMPKSVTPC